MIRLAEYAKRRQSTYGYVYVPWSLHTQLIVHSYFADIDSDTKNTAKFTLLDLSFCFLSTFIL